MQNRWKPTENWPFKNKGSKHMPFKWWYPVGQSRAGNFWYNRNENKKAKKSWIGRSFDIIPVSSLSHILIWLYFNLFFLFSFFFHCYNYSSIYYLIFEYLTYSYFFLNSRLFWPLKPDLLDLNSKILNTFSHFYPTYISFGFKNRF